MNEFVRGFNAGRKSVLRKNESGCCCLFNEDEEIVELCMAHKEREARLLSEHGAEHPGSVVALVRELDRIADKECVCGDDEEKSYEDYGCERCKAAHIINLIGDILGENGFR
jgi:hypothetical protein